MTGKKSRFVLRQLGLFDSREKKAGTVLIRWVMVVAASALVLFGREGQSREALLLVVLLLSTNLFLNLLPTWLFEKRSFSFILVLFDVFLLSFCVWFSGELGGEFYLLYFLVIMVAALGDTFVSVFLSVCAISIVYIFLGIGLSEASLYDPAIWIHVLFFFVVGLFFGYFALRVRAERRDSALVRKKLGVAEHLARLTKELSSVRGDKEIFEKAAREISEFDGVDYCAFVSKASFSIIEEAGELTMRPSDAVVEAGLQGVFEAAEGEKGFGVPGCDKGGLRGCHLELGDYSVIFGGQGEDSDLLLMVSPMVSSDLAIYLEIALENLRLALKNIGRYQALVQEAERRRDLVQELSNALRFRSDLVANISHEIRTPIYTLIGFGELIESGAYGEVNSEQRSVLARMLSNARRLLELVDDILEFSRAESGAFEAKPFPGHFPELAREVVEACEPLVADKAVRILLDEHGFCPSLLVDWKILRQVLMNLVSNAVKFTKRGSIEVSWVYDAETSSLAIDVKDSGVGIAEEDQKLIFEPFRQLETGYSRKYTGSGLGLAITRKHVETLGGELYLESELGVGSRFTVRLPVKEAA